jgi:hypothetical protein
MSTQVAIPPAAIYVCGGMLFSGAALLPYGYYTLFRFIGCAAFALAAYVSFNRSGKSCRGYSCCNRLQPFRKGSSFERAVGNRRRSCTAAPSGNFQTYQKQR